MSRCSKLLELAKRSPKGVRLADALKLAACHGYVHSRTKGSHHICRKDNEREHLNFQEMADGTVPAYQIRQLLTRIAQGEAENDGHTT